MTSPCASSPSDTLLISNLVSTNFIADSSDKAWKVASTGPSALILAVRSPRSPWLSVNLAIAPLPILVLISKSISDQGPVLSLLLLRIIASMSPSVISFFLSAIFLNSINTRSNFASFNEKPSCSTRWRKACRPLCFPKTRLDFVKPTSSGLMIS